MDPETFDTVDPLVDKIAELAEKQLDSEELRGLLAELGSRIGQRRIASVSIVVDVFDEDRECSLPLLTTGLSAFPGKEPYRTWGDSTPQRYVVDDVSRSCRMIAARIAGKFGISSCKTRPVSIAAPKWESVQAASGHRRVPVV